MNNMQKAFEKKSALRRIRMADGGLVGKIKSVFDPEDDRSASDKAAGIPKPGSREENEQLSLRVVKKPGVFPTLGRSEMQRDMRREHNERELRMADGGLVDRAASDLASRKSKLDEAENAAVGGQPTAPAKPQPAPAPKPQTDDEKRAAVGMPPKKGLLRTLLGMKEGGHVVGPGGPREDKVPAMLSDGEYVLPAKTVQKLGGPEEIDELVRATNDGREPEGAEERDEGRHTLRKLSGGGFVGPLALDDPRYAAAQNRAFAPTGAGMQSSVSMGEGLQGPTRPAGAPTPVQAAPVSAPVEAPKPGLVGRGLRAAASVAKNVLPAAVVQQGFGDYKADTGGVDTSAPGTLRYLAKGDFGNVGASLSGGAAETLADVGSGVAKVVDGVGGFFGANPGAKAGYDSFVKEQTGGYLSPRNPNGATLPQGTSLAGAGRGFVNPPGTPVGPGPEGLKPEGQGVPTDAAPSPRSLAQARYLAEQGVDAATQANAPVKLDIVGTGPNGVVTKNTGLRNISEPGKFMNLGSFQGPDNIYGTSSKPGGRVDSFVGAGDPNRQETPQTIQAVAKLQSDLAADKIATAQKEEAQRQAQASQGNSGAINARFDAMAGKVAGSYSKTGKGNENKRLLEIEAQRNNALEADARNNISLRGQNQQMQIAQANNQVQARGQDLGLEGHKQTLNQGREFHNDTLRQNAVQFAATQKQRDQALEEQNVKDRTAAVNELISRRFPDAKKAGSPDGEKAIDYTNFIAKQDPKLVAAYTKGNATEREEALATIDRLYETREKVNARGSSSLRGTTSLDTVLPKGAPRPVEFGDYWGQGSLPWSQIWRRGAAVIGADAGKVQDTSIGQTVPLNDLTNDDSSVISNGKNASKVSALHQQRAMQQELERQARIERLKQEATKK